MRECGVGLSGSVLGKLAGPCERDIEPFGNEKRVEPRD
jgi:hypothetical protein